MLATWRAKFGLLVYSVVSLAFCSLAFAADVTLVLKGGGGFQIVGELRSYDGSKYIIVNPSFGRMEVDGSRFDCVSEGCPTGPVGARLSPASLFVGGPPRSVTISGSNAVGGRLMPAIIKAFAAKSRLSVTQVAQPDPRKLVYQFTNSAGREVATINLLRRGSTSSFRSLASKRAAIGMSSRPIRDAEVRRLRTAGLGNMRDVTHEHVIGLDGLIILASPENPAISMSIDNVAKVFAGQIVDWSQLGLPPGPITVHAPEYGTGTWDTFNALVLRPRNLALTVNAKRTANHAQQADLVAADPLAIGVVGTAYQRSGKALNMEASCGLITPPSNFSIKTEEYPLSRRLFLYTAGRPSEPLAASLLDFALSNEAQPVVRKVDFVDRGADLISFTEQGSRVAYALNAPRENFDLSLMRTLLTDLKGSERLTHTFRFNVGSFFLDNKSLQDVTLLGDVLNKPALSGRSIKLIGFADSAGSFRANLTLSVSRAEAVRAAILKETAGKVEPARLIVKGYGELAPVACNDTPAGKSFNRRVEVWVERAR